MVSGVSSSTRAVFFDLPCRIGWVRAISSFSGSIRSRSLSAWVLARALAIFGCVYAVSMVNKWSMMLCDNTWNVLLDGVVTKFRSSCKV